MNTTMQPRGIRAFSVGSIALGILGGTFFWWVPLGMVLSLAGLTLGMVDGISARRRSLAYQLAVVGCVISLVSLGLDLSIAFRGLQTLTFGMP